MYSTNVVRHRSCPFIGYTHTSFDFKPYVFLQNHTSCFTRHLCPQLGTQLFSWDKKDVYPLLVFGGGLLTLRAATTGMPLCL